MLFLLFLFPVTVAKRPARELVPQGGSDPTKLLGGFAAKKWGRSRPILPFCHGDFLFFAFPISPTFKDFGAFQGEEAGSAEGAERNLYLLHPHFTEFGPAAEIRPTKRVSKWTVRLRSFV